MLAPEQHGISDGGVIVLGVASDGVVQVEEVGIRSEDKMVRGRSRGGEGEG